MSAKLRVLLLASTVAIGGTMASAQTAADSVVTNLVGEGFTRVEIKTGLFRTRVEAVRGTETRELVINNATGEVVKSESGTLEVGDDTAPGIFVQERERERDRDRNEFRVSSRNGDDDDGTHDDEDDHGNGHGSDDGPDHDSNDDHGDDHGGGDHDGGDSGHGGDHDGDDD